jgi:hypothetical protein
MKNETKALGQWPQLQTPPKKQNPVTDSRILRSAPARINENGIIKTRHLPYTTNTHKAVPQKLSRLLEKHTQPLASPVVVLSPNLQSPLPPRASSSANSQCSLSLEYSSHIPRYDPTRLKEPLSPTPRGNPMPKSVRAASKMLHNLEYLADSFFAEVGFLSCTDMMWGDIEDLQVDIQSFMTLESDAYFHYDDGSTTPADVDFEGLNEAVGYLLTRLDRLRWMYRDKL